MSVCSLLGLQSENSRTCGVTMRQNAIHIPSLGSFALKVLTRTLGELWVKADPDSGFLNSYMHTPKIVLSFQHDVIVTSSPLLPIQAAYRNNTLGLPNNCPEENINKITVSDLKQFLSSHYLSSRMVLTGINVDHDHLVDLEPRLLRHRDFLFGGECSSLQGLCKQTATNSLSCSFSVYVCVSVRCFCPGQGTY